MNIQNYFPEPTEIAGNVSRGSYKVLLSFIKRVALLHFFTLVLAYAIGYYSFSYWKNLSFLYLSVGAILTLSLNRILLPKYIANWLSFPMLAILLIFLGPSLIFLKKQGVPIIEIGIAMVIAQIYSLGCRRDFSFIGLFFLTALSSFILLEGLSSLYFYPNEKIFISMAYIVGYLLYYVYDLACLLNRRTNREVIPAISDLYCDVFNFFGYALRVVRHWRSFKL